MDIVELDGRAVRRLKQVVDAAAKAPDDDPTPCTEWTVGDLLHHIVAVNTKYAQVGRGAAWEPGVPDVELGTDVAGVYRETMEPLASAWRQPGALERTLHLPTGEAPAELALWTHFREVLVHGWDLAVAIRVPAPFEDDLAQACLDQARQTGMPATRPPGLGFADARPALPGAAPIERLAAFFGRDAQAWT
jgi:uncharacterized protein (TIGR03086 family)